MNLFDLEHINIKEDRWGSWRPKSLAMWSIFIYACKYVCLCLLVVSYIEFQTFKILKAIDRSTTKVMVLAPFISVYFSRQKLNQRKTSNDERYFNCHFWKTPTLNNNKMKETTTYTQRNNQTRRIGSRK